MNRRCREVAASLARQTRGEAEGAQDNVGEALTCYSEAYEAFSAANNVYEAARCKVAMVHLLAMRDAAGDEQRARRARDEARQNFERLGADSELHADTASPPIFPNVKALSKA